jgi:LysR family transcriptional regulator, transcriptional activator of nhaA
VLAVTLHDVLNFNHLYYFHVVAVEGSVKAAAERLGVTQPTVSEQLRMLERALGVPLFERAPGGLRLTDRGREAFEHTTTMFLAGERLVSALGHGSAKTPLSLRVGMSAAVSRTIAADFLMPVLTFEQCQPSIRMGEFTELLRELRGHELDLLIGETEPIEAARPNIEVSVIHRPSLVAIVRPDLEPREDWQNLSLLEYRPTSAYHWEVDNFLRDHGLRPKTMGEVDDAFLMLEAVSRGGFVAFVPKSVARAAVEQGRVRALTQFRPTSAGVHALFHRTEGPDLAREAVAKLIEHAREHFERED